MNYHNLVLKGKKLSYLLRHDTKYSFDKNGWRNVSDLIKNHNFSMQELEKIVETNDKKRYEFSIDKKKIRARQGHSVNVDVELQEKTPPDILYHGTATKFLDSIFENGINSGNRLYVHLSNDEETAVKVGSRHGIPHVLKIDANRMFNDGNKFYLSNNNVWLTKFVDKKYII